MKKDILMAKPLIFLLLYKVYVFFEYSLNQIEYFSILNYSLFSYFLLSFSLIYSILLDFFL